MKTKILIFLSFFIISFLQAEDIPQEEKSFKFLGDVTLSAGMTYITIDDIVTGHGTEAAIVETDPIAWGGFKAILFPESLNISFGYSTTFTTSTDETTSTQSDRENTSEQIKLAIPITDYFLAKYTKYTFNSSFTATKTVAYLDKSNTSAVNGTYYFVDNGVEVIDEGETTGASIESKRYDFLFRIPLGSNIVPYFGYFQEELIKPWSDTTTKWYLIVNNVVTSTPFATVYKEARFETKGFTFGTTIKDSELSPGLSISEFGMDIALLEIYLTDNYNLKDNKNISTYDSLYKLSINMEIAYKSDTKFLGDSSNFIFAVFGKYDHHYIDYVNSNKVDLNLSDDYIYGFRASLVF